MNTGDWLILLTTVPAGFGYAGYAIGKLVGRHQARPCTICRSAEQPRHDQHSTWRCVDMDGCSVRNERRERNRAIVRDPREDEFRARYEGRSVAEAASAQLGRLLEIPGDQAIRVADLAALDPAAGDPSQDDGPRRTLEDL